MTVRSWRAGAWARRLGALLLGTLLLWLAQPAAAQVLLLRASDGQVELGSAGVSWLDVGSGRPVEDLAADASVDWQPTSSRAVHPLRPGASLWLRFDVAEVDDSERWYLQLPYPAVNRVTLHTRDAGGRWSRASAGDTLPVSAWPLPHRHPLLPLSLVPGQTQRFWLQVENPHGFGSPLVFTAERELLRQEQRTALVLGLFFGLAALAVLLAVPAAWWLRDAAFAWYGLTVALMGLTQAATTGAAGLHLWPALAWWNDMSVFVLPLSAIAALLVFLSRVVALRERSPRLHGLLVLLALLCFATSAALPLVDPGWRARIMSATLVLSVSAGVAVIVWAALRGDRHAGWMLAGMVPVAIGSAFPLLRLLGVIPVSFWTQYSMQFGLAVEVPLLLAVLLVRSHERRETSRRIDALERTDPGTGLITTPVFFDRLRRLILRSGRLRQESLVLLVDIVNSEQLEREFGLQARDLPLLVAGRLVGAAREIDSVARLAEHRFGMLVEGPLAGDDEAAATGAKVVARCLMPFKDKPVACVPQLRVAQLRVPSGEGPQQVLDRLAALLASVPADSKRAVFTASKAAATTERLPA